MTDSDAADAGHGAGPRWLCADRGHGWRLADGRADNATDRVGETPCVFLAGLHRAERTIAERLLRLANGTQPWPWIDPDKALPRVEGRIGIALAESQVAAIRLVLMSKVLVITGGPGVGKTTIVNAILRILAAKGINLLLCAPTGRAAKRMTEASGFEAKTIHRLLEVDPKGGGFKRGDDNPLDCDLLVIDETSMVDVMLMQAFMKAVPDTAREVCAGAPLGHHRSRIAGERDLLDGQYVAMGVRRRVSVKRSCACTISTERK